MSRLTLLLLVCTTVVFASNSSALYDDDEDDCEKWHGTCELVRQNCALGNGGTFLIPYYYIHECVLGSMPWLSYTLLGLWLVVLFILLGTTADNFFVTQLETMSAQLKLSPSTAAITLLALGNSSPDVFSDLAAVQNNSDFSLAVGELMGASMFLTTVVLAGVILVSTRNGGKCSMDYAPIRDIIVFSIAILIVFAMSFDGKIYLWEAVIIIGVYIAYVAGVVGYTKFASSKSAKKAFHRMSSMFTSVTKEKLSNMESGSLNEGTLRPSEHSALLNPAMDAAFGEDDEADDDEANVLIGIEWDSSASILDKIIFVVEYPFSWLRWLSIPSSDDSWSWKRRALAAFSPIGCVCVFFLDFSPNWTGGTPYDGFSQPINSVTGPVPIVVIPLLLAVVFGLVIFFASNNTDLPKWHIVLVIIAFVSTVAWLDLLGNECVAALEVLGSLTGVSSSRTGHSLLGITLLAWANSIGDLVADTAVARAGRPQMGVSSVFGSPLLTCCLGIGISTLIASIGSPDLSVESKFDPELQLSYIFLGISLLSSLVVMISCKFVFPMWYAFYLILVYCLYMVSSSLTVTNVLHWAIW